MLRGLWFNLTTWFCLWVPLAIVVLLFRYYCRYYLEEIRAAPNKTICMRVDAFREPINAALTIGGIVVPLLCAAISFFALEEKITPSQLVPLLCSTLLFVFSVLVGLWNIFSLTTAKGDDLKLTEKNNGGFVAQFIVQLALMFAGFIVLAVYFLWFFQPAAGVVETPAADPPARAEANYGSDRPFLPVGTKEEQVRATWGRPAAISADGDRVTWRYHDPKMDFVVILRDGVVDSVLMQRKEK
jgi:hypothetical protein